jgi:hypothetical protein
MGVHCPEIKSSPLHMLDNVSNRELHLCKVLMSGRTDRSYKTSESIF